jgi:outer membrane protein OmpA-like peptidoglycan-associated protein
MKRIAAVAGGLGIAALLLMMGCSLRKEEGGLAGAGVVVGDLRDAAPSTARSAIIGASVGGVAGGVIGDQMDRQAEELRHELADATVERVGEGIQITFPDGLLFDFDSDDLSAVGRKYLKALAISLAKYPRTRSLIVGHTDSRPPAGAYYLGLSERRAKSAATFLAAHGLDRARMRIIDRGSSEPVATNDSSAGREQNRRVEVAIYADEALRYAASRD